MRKVLAGILAVLALAVATSVSWGVTWEGVTWEGVTWEGDGAQTWE
jgi:hypothetical protein